MGLDLRAAMHLEGDLVVGHVLATQQLSEGKAEDTFGLGLQVRVRVQVGVGGGSWGWGWE